MYNVKIPDHILMLLAVKIGKIINVYGLEKISTPYGIGGGKFYGFVIDSAGLVKMMTFSNISYGMQTYYTPP